MRTGLHPDDERDPQLVEESQQGHVSKTPSGRHDDAAFAYGLGHPSHCTTADRQLVAFPASL
jgi:hypothetical protein